MEKRLFQFILILVKIKEIIDWRDVQSAGFDCFFFTDACHYRDHLYTSFLPNKSENCEAGG